MAIRSEIYSINADSLEFNSELVYSKSYLPKLGNLDKDTNILDSSVNHAKRNIREILNKFSNFGFDYLRVVGTAVFRQAKNSAQVVHELEKVLQHKLDILSEQEEASFIALGIAKFEKDLPESYLLLDIGGRSSELSYVASTQIMSSHSFPIGAIAIRNNYFKENVPTREEIENTQAHIRSLLSSEIKNYKDKSSVLIGSSGTIRMIGRFFNLSHPHDTKIPPSFVDSLLCQLLEDPNSSQNKKLVAMEKNRQELVYSGMLLTQEFYNALGVEHIRVTNYSLRHGILFDLAKDHFQLG